MYFRIIYILFLVSSLVLGSIYIGSVSCRQLFTIIMLVFCLMETKKIWIDKCFKYFLIFSFFFGMTSFDHGYFSEFAKLFVAYYLVALVGFWATVIICEKGYIMDCFHTIVALGVFDAFITALQSFGNPLAMAVGLIFAPEEVEKMAGSLMQGELVSMAIMGIFGAVYNGYYLLVTSVISLLYVFKYKTLIKFIPFGICFIGSFLCQQRSPFFINCLFLSFFILKYFKSLSLSYKIVLFAVIILVISFLLPLFIKFSTQNDMRYSSIGLEGMGREEIYQFAETYILENLISANIFDFRKIYGYSPHMLIYNMLIYGGVLGFVFITISLILQLKKTILSVLKPLKKDNALLFFASGAFLVFTANSLTHNSSIVTGDLLIWVLWGCVYASSQSSNIYNTPE